MYFTGVLFLSVTSIFTSLHFLMSWILLLWYIFCEQHRYLLHYKDLDGLLQSHCQSGTDLQLTTRRWRVICRSSCLSTLHLVCSHPANQFAISSTISDLVGLIGILFRKSSPQCSRCSDHLLCFNSTNLAHGL